MSVEISQIRSLDWSRQVGGYGEIAEQLADIDQCIRIICATPKGAVEHRPDFGCNAWRYLDHPVNEALPHIIRECTDAIAQWEPRATVTDITSSVHYSTVTLKIAWDVVLGTTSSVTEATYALSNPQ